MTGSLPKGEAGLSLAPATASPDRACPCFHACPCGSGECCNCGFLEDQHPTRTTEAHGTWEDFKRFDRALSASEVEELYRNGSRTDKDDGGGPGD